ncbi:MAG: T9SS type A sorting domain-containing protein [Chitinophagales bacterium]|nr:T9SS type A sorting domain-containing protein [Chitinophagales bacterium]
MKTKIISRTVVLSLSLSLLILTVSLFLQTKQVTAQCSLTDIMISPDGDWPYTYNNSEDQNDICYRAISIMDDGELIGYVGVGTTYTGGSNIRDGIIIRLNTDGSPYTGWGPNNDGIVITGGDRNDVIYAVAQAADGNIIACGTKRTNTFGSPKNDNVWFLKLDLSDGSVIAEEEYGGSGSEDGFDIIEDAANDYYVIAGAAGENADGTLSDFSGTGINGTGEYWVLAIDRDDYTKQWQAIYHGSYTGGEQADWARGIFLDHAGDWIVTGYCFSCETIANDNQQLMLVKIPSGGGTFDWKLDYGFDHKDQGGDYVIEVFDGVDYAYLSPGIAHTPGPPQGSNCYGTTHDIYGLKTDVDGTTDADWLSGCQLDEGLNFGGSLKDDGYGVAQICDGDYLFVGDTRSEDNDVECNENEGTLDMWIVRMTPDGVIDWEETIGTDYDDIAHSIKSVSDGSYVIGGELGTANQSDFYMTKFEFTAACAKPTGLSQVKSGCCVTASWTMDPCVPKYILKYKKATGSTWNTIDPAVSPEEFCNEYNSNSNYVWTVQAVCSPNNISDTAFKAVQGLTVCPKLGNEQANEDDNDILIVYPNPSGGSVDIVFTTAATETPVATITILDQIGKVVRIVIADMSDGKLERQISLKDLPPGFYWIKLDMGGKVFEDKIILQSN